MQGVWLGGGAVVVVPLKVVLLIDLCFSSWLILHSAHTSVRISCFSTHLLLLLARRAPLCSAAKSLIVQSHTLITLQSYFPTVPTCVCVRLGVSPSPVRLFVPAVLCCCAVVTLPPRPPQPGPCLTGYHGVNPWLRLTECLHVPPFFIIYIRCNPVFHLALCRLVYAVGERRMK